MIHLKIYQVDAFTDTLFGGNPAAVCPLEEWLPDETMQKIAMENNLSETAFFVKDENEFHIRWFTPKVEVSLCGHATLASAHVIFNYLALNGEEIRFNSKSGLLTVKKEKELLTLNFPTDPIRPANPPSYLINAMKVKPLEIYQGRTDYLLILGSQNEVESAEPDLPLLKKLPVRGVIISARGDASDFVSRFFAPGSGVDEDPVTGSAHTSMIPYWANKLGKAEMTAVQLSPRKGHLFCKYLGERVEIGGRAVTYLTGEINF